MSRELLQQALDALEAGNLQEDQIVAGTAAHLVLRMPIAAISQMASARDAIRDHLAAQPAPVPPNCTEDDARGLRLVGPHGGVMSDIPNPTDAELESSLFEAIWQATKTWDVNVPEYYKGYCGMNGSHVVMILRAIAIVSAAPVPPMVPLTDEQVAAGIAAWFATKISGNPQPFGGRMRAAYAAINGIAAPGATK